MIDFIRIAGVAPVRDRVDPMRVRWLLFHSKRFKARIGEALRSDWFIDKRLLPTNLRKAPAELIVRIFKEFYDDAKDGR